MQNKLFCHQIKLAKIVGRLKRLGEDQRGTIAVMMAFLFPILIAGFGLGYEITNWYLQTRSMQNAADAAAIAAATNGSDNYNVEATAVAAQYGFVNGTNNVTVTASNAAACPADPSIIPPCYSVTITGVVPLFLTEVIGYLGNSSLNGGRQQSLTSAAVATNTVIKKPLCMLGLDTLGTGIRTNGAPKATFDGCTVMSDSAATCNGSNLDADWGLAHTTNSNCGNKKRSDIPIVPDPYAYMATAIPSDLPTKCANTYPKESKQGNTWSGGTAWTGSKTLSGTASLATNTLVCGDLRLTGDVTINAPQPNGAVLYIQNGLLDLQGHTLQTANGSAVTIVFTGDDNASYNHIPTDNKNGGGGVLNIEAPTQGDFAGIALYQNPSLTQNVDISYAGNAPTWDLTGGVYVPHAQVTISGAINKSANGAVCLVMVAKDILVNGTGDIFSQTPDGSGCKNAGLNMPTATIPGRSKLVY
jgi:hypothetical protein